MIARVRKWITVLVMSVLSVLVAAQDNINATASLIEVDKKARLAQKNDEQSVRSLVDTICATFAILPEAQPAATLIKPGVVRAELDFRQGRHAGVTDAAVSRAVNRVMRGMNAPEYAFTDIYEVRRTRAGLLTVAPFFLTANIGKGHAGLPTMMSPAEALLVTVTLVQQKFINPDFQLTAKERVARWSELRAPKQTTGRIKAEAPSPRTIEMKDVFDRALKQRSLRDFMDSTESALNELGIGL